MLVPACIALKWKEAFRLVVNKTCHPRYLSTSVTSLDPGCRTNILGHCNGGWFAGKGVCGLGLAFDPALVLPVELGVIDRQRKDFFSLSESTRMLVDIGARSI